MPLEPDFDFIDDLVPANPDDDDLVLEGAAHLRGIKQSLQGSVSGDVDATRLLVNSLVALILTRDPGPVIALFNEAQEKLMDLGFLVGDDLTLLNDTATGLLILAGAAGTVFEGDPLGRSRMFNAGVERIAAEALGASVTGDLAVTGVATAAAPTLAEHLTRKDYVDGEVADVQADANANAAAIGVNAGNISTNAANIGTNTGELAGIFGNTGQQRIQVGQMQILSGTSTASGTTVTVTFAVAFTSTPAISGEGVAGTSFVQTRLISVSTTGFSVSVSISGSGYNWHAMGTNTA